MEPDTEDGYKYLLQQEREKYAVLCKRINHEATIALDALNANPPFIPAIRERLINIAFTTE